MNERDQTAEAEELRHLLDQSDISVLDGFKKNISITKRFNETYCSNRQPSVVLCGINPGRLGAGKTGIPFLDFCSVSKLLTDVDRSDTERSAQFFFEIINHFGAKNFYSIFHITNVSSVGFEKSGKNVNYYDLPEPAFKYVLRSFKEEIDSINPNTIISLSEAVHSTVRSLFRKSLVDTSIRLPHPSYCAFPKQRVPWKEKYIDILSRYIAA